MDNAWLSVAILLNNVHPITVRSFFTRSLSALVAMKDMRRLMVCVCKCHQAIHLAVLSTMEAVRSAAYGISFIKEDAMMYG
ncbi:Hypothetical protein GL50581_3115 [Giardia duodenalis ATCC 50581]|uniref:Uncharacterized protein n=1 Tax=Giardia intestinalis (strain ATCC 50581 / GS clone H7) TaxID=598745 RepID=C6LWF7_GIAIB|nr:Hypothetical protein GL50581_3115 [Giardia intestinalis ATCC 50581]